MRCCLPILWRRSRLRRCPLPVKTDKQQTYNVSNNETTMITCIEENNTPPDTARCCCSNQFQLLFDIALSWWRRRRRRRSLLLLLLTAAAANDTTWEVEGACQQCVRVKKRSNWIVATVRRDLVASLPVTWSSFALRG